MSANERMTKQHDAKMVGHGEEIERVISAKSSGRMHHAWLISGPQGVGKSMFAKQFAKWLLQRGPEDSSATVFSYPENDPGAHKVQALTHPDFMLIDSGADLLDVGKSNGTIVVDEVRAASSFSHKMPVESHYRVLIVDSIDEMNFNASNALLKVLEEPPENMVLILLNHAPGKVLPTIRSRCYQLKLNPLSFEEFRRVLLRDHALSTIDLEKLYKITAGAPGMALEAISLHLLPTLSKLPQVLQSNDIEAWRELIALCKKHQSSITSIADLLLSTLRIEISEIAAHNLECAHTMLQSLMAIEQAFVNAKKSHLDLESALLAAFNNAALFAR
ncbi:MAG: AAA family ATPase [Proteobacteria bacterium]|nr:AAA family ATPase [Pseudomonadota bacterium]